MNFSVNFMSRLVTVKEICLLQGAKLYHSKAVSETALQGQKQT